MSLEKRKNIALIAHDNKKDELLAQTRYNREILKEHNLFATGTTGSKISTKLELDVIKFKSGPLGGDQQIGAAIAEGRIDFMIFFLGSLEPLPHDPDVKALLRIAAVYNIPAATNRSTAYFLISSPLMNEVYKREITAF